MKARQAVIVKPFEVAVHVPDSGKELVRSARYRLSQKSASVGFMLTVHRDSGSIRQSFNSLSMRPRNTCICNTESVGPLDHSSATAGNLP